MSYSRQRGFWLRDNKSFKDDYSEPINYYLEHFGEDNRAIWCEEEPDIGFTLEEIRTVALVKSIPVRCLANDYFTESPEWFPNEEPYGGMLWLTIKREL